jgi:RNA polymerase sigma-70 factor (ECF subfamily)
MRQILEDYIFEHRESLYRLAFSYVRQADDALDIVQEAIYKALSHVESLENPAAVKSWMYRIVVRTALDTVKKRERVLYVTDDIIEAQAAPTEPTQDFDLMEALRRLPEEQRSVVVLRFFEDMKFSDIAQVLEVNVNTVKTRLYKALQLLRLDLAEPELAKALDDDAAEGGGRL